MPLPVALTPVCSGGTERSSCLCIVLTLNPQVTVGRDDAVEGGLSNFLLEAEGMAAKAWLLVHGGNWREVLEATRVSQVFGQKDELEGKSGSKRKNCGDKGVEDRRKAKVGAVNWWGSEGCINV